jgi:hypothetical protein
MGRGTALSDHGVDELIAGRSPAGLHDLRPLADVTQALRVRAANEVAPPMGHALRMSLANASATTAPNQWSRIRHRLPGLAAVGVGVIVFGTMTAANALPAPVQHIVADAGTLVGVDVPTPDEGSDEPTGSSDAKPDEDGAESEPATTHEDSGPTKVRPEPNGSGPPEGTPRGALPADPRERGAPGDHAPATPAEPGTPGDHAPADPAMPPEHSKGRERPNAGDREAPTRPEGPAKDDKTDAGPGD